MQIDFMGELQVHPPPEQIIRSLSWAQPFGSLMLHGKKETRSKPTNVRGLVLICTCKKAYTDQKTLAIAGIYQLDRIRETLEDEPTADLHGYAIGLGSLVNCRRMLTSDENDCFVQHSNGLWVWEFANVRRIKPFPWPLGKQGWGVVQKEYRDKIVFT